MGVVDDLCSSPKPCKDKKTHIRWYYVQTHKINDLVTNPTTDNLNSSSAGKDELVSDDSALKIVGPEPALGVTRQDTRRIRRWFVNQRCRSW